MRKFVGSLIIFGLVSKNFNLIFSESVSKLSRNLFDLLLLKMATSITHHGKHFFPFFLLRLGHFHVMNYVINSSASNPGYSISLASLISCELLIVQQTGQSGAEHVLSAAQFRKHTC